MPPQTLSPPADIAPVLDAPVPPRACSPAEGRGAFRGLPRELSAQDLLWPWQAAVLLLGAAAGLLLFMLAGAAGLGVLMVLLALPFGFGAAIRLLALWHGLAPGGYGREWAEATLPSDHELPRYSVLVPLYREAHVVPGLVAALGDLDYPPERLEILLVTEEVDLDTQAAIADEKLPMHMRMVVIDDGQPRTKPRAVNHALGQATGEYVVVYDAEDQPDPDQLRRALAVLRSDPARMGCVQAALNTYNANDSWLTRHFTAEYTGLFDLTLPALDRFGMVVPLGGTSNHFPRRVLEEMSGWDPYNVTEDADLGIRLARAGYRVATLTSTTWEECPVRFSVWLGQRTRWLKGWMQTWLVHMRRPSLLIAELGWWKFATLQLLLANLVLSPLMHPWLYAGLMMAYLNGEPFGPPEDRAGAALFWISVANIGAGYAAAAGLAAMAVARRGWPELMKTAATLPFYWLAISLASYLALIQLIRAPHFWDKTEHAGRARPRATSRGAS